MKKVLLSLSAWPASLSGPGPGLPRSALLFRLVLSPCHHLWGVQWERGEGRANEKDKHYREGFVKLLKRACLLESAN